LRCCLFRESSLLGKAVLNFQEQLSVRCASEVATSWKRQFSAEKSLSYRFAFAFETVVSCQENGHRMEGIKMPHFRTTLRLDPDDNTEIRTKGKVAASQRKLPTSFEAAKQPTQPGAGSFSTSRNRTLSKEFSFFC
jgi:hypothetical protein